MGEARLVRKSRGKKRVKERERKSENKNVKGEKAS